MLGYASVCRDSRTDVQLLINAPVDIANQVSLLVQVMYAVTTWTTIN